MSIHLPASPAEAPATPPCQPTATGQPRLLIRVIPAWARPGGYGPGDVPQMRRTGA
ncbi:hypothetical protein GCM10010442_13180 [Kitasatospora kifunensis]